jgi:lipocalin
MSFHINSKNECNQHIFDINKYKGVWFELMHYPSWFQGSNTYNTKAIYTILNNQIQVHNSTIVNGQQYDSYGTAKIIKNNQLRVDFPMTEVNKLISSSQFETPDQTFFDKKYTNEPNYIIDYIWTNTQDQYMISIVTDLDKNSLYVLSRVKNPSLAVYNEVMSYVSKHYDVKKIVQTPHY